MVTLYNKQEIMIYQLCKTLLSAMECNGDSLIEETVIAIRSALSCDMCTLWSINHNNTNEKYGEFMSASLLSRSLTAELAYPNSNKKDEDYVHGLQHCFIKQVLDEVQKKGSAYLECTIGECRLHLSYEILKAMGLTYFICIPITRSGQVVAFMKLAYIENPRIENIDSAASIINNAVASSLSRHLQYQKQQIINDLIQNYNRKNSIELKKILYPVIFEIFRKYFDYEGASVFIWDSYENHYNLIITTGLKDVVGIKDIYYNEGEGLTGKVAAEKHERIYDDLLKLEQSNDPEYLHKYKEDTNQHGKTMLVLPIFRPSNSENVFGIIRFTNKINKQSKKDGKNVIDFFNDMDVELIENALHYLALNIDNYLAEEERKDFISKLSHESKTPANAIKVTADRIQKKILDDRFMRLQFPHYLQSIIDYADLQMMQASTNLYISKSNRKKSKVGTYDVQSYSIVEIIKSSINIVRPFAREHEVMFSNIIIEEEFPNIFLRVDKGAFQIVFYNLLTNAIKYVRRDTEFRVAISAYQTSEFLIIHVADDGIGIQDKEKNRIFLLGVRSDKAKKTNSEGYGIGLHVVKQILTDFDCVIRVLNNENPTIFEIKIPRKLYSYKLI